jgi:ribose 5-phosphate isomerase RpiB
VLVRAVSWAVAAAVVEVLVVVAAGVAAVGCRTGAGAREAASGSSGVSAASMFLEQTVVLQASLVRIA